MSKTKLTRDRLGSGSFFGDHLLVRWVSFRLSQPRTVINWTQEDDIATKTLIYGLVSYATYYRDRQCFSEISDVLQEMGALPDSYYEEIRRRYDNVVNFLPHRIFIHNWLRELSQTTKVLIVSGEPFAEVTYALPIWEALTSPQTDPLFVMVRKTMSVDFSIGSL